MSDRAVAAVVLRVGGATWPPVRELIKAAVEESAKTQRAQFRKAEPIWRFFALSLKRLYENAGWIWTPTRVANEPNPNLAPAFDAQTIEPTRNAPDDEDDFDAELRAIGRRLGRQVVAPPKPNPRVVGKDRRFRDVPAFA